MMSLITRHLVAELLKVFLLTVVVLTAILLFAGTLKEYQKQGFTLSQISLVVPFLVPHAVKVALRAGLLFAVCHVFGTMAANNELLAIKSSGISPRVVVWPTLVLAVAITLLGGWLDHVGNTWGRGGVQRVLVRTADEVAYGMLESDRYFRRKHFSIVVKKVVGRRLIEPSLTYQLPGTDDIVKATAREGELYVDHDENRLGIRLHHGTVRLSDDVKVRFGNNFEQLLPLNIAAKKDVNLWMLIRQHSLVRFLEDGLGQSTHADEAATAAEIERYDQARTERDKMARRLNWRWSNASCCLCFAMIGMPVAMLLRTHDWLTSFFACFVPVLAIYYPLQTFVSNLTRSGELPSVCLWAGNFLLLAVGGALLRRILRH